MQHQKRGVQVQRRRRSALVFARRERRGQSAPFAGRRGRESEHPTTKMHPSACRLGRARARGRERPEGAGSEQRQAAAPLCLACCSRGSLAQPSLPRKVAAEDIAPAAGYRRAPQGRARPVRPPARPHARRNRDRTSSAAEGGRAGGGAGRQLQHRLAWSSSPRGRSGAHAHPSDPDRPGGPRMARPDASAPATTARAQRVHNQSSRQFKELSTTTKDPPGRSAVRDVLSPLPSVGPAPR